MAGRARLRPGAQPLTGYRVRVSLACSINDVSARVVSAKRVCLYRGSFSVRVSARLVLYPPVFPRISSGQKNAGNAKAPYNDDKLLYFFIFLNGKIRIVVLELC